MVHETHAGVLLCSGIDEFVINTNAIMMLKAMSLRENTSQGPKKTVLRI